MPAHREQLQLETVQSLYKAVSDPAADLSSYLSENFVILEAPGLPYAGVYRGRDALRALVNWIGSRMSVSNVTIERYAVGADHVIATLRFDLTLNDGSSATQYVAEEFLFEDGLIREMRPFYFDSSLISRAAASSAATVKQLEARAMSFREESGER
jgi:hypothetical protein